jgi:3-deoxy-D-manno-octulosonic-acid transferase
VQRPDLTLMVTCSEALTSMTPPEGCGIAAGRLPPEQPAAVRSFLSHWRPDLCLWSGGGFHPLLLKHCRDAGIPAILADVEATDLPARKTRWLPDQSRRLMDCFSAILTPSQPAQEQLRRAGVPADKIQLTARLRISASPPMCNEEELDRVQRDLGSRPVWLAAQTEPEELDQILTAHRKSLRHLHRMLLVIAMDDFQNMAAARAAVEEKGLRCCDWEAGEDLHDNTQVLLTVAEDLGLWYRAAPLTLMAGTLAGSTGGHNPLDAAALGTAVIHGPRTSSHAALYRRLQEAGAALRVRNGAELANEVIRLAAPDAAAQMALAGWQVVTEGAHLTDELLERIQDLLDLREGENASV